MFQTTNCHLQPADGILMPSLRKYSSLAVITRTLLKFVHLRGQFYLTPTLYKIEYLKH